MALFDTLSAVWDGMNTARDLAVADPSTLNPVENMARSGVRAYCRIADWTDQQVWTLGAGVGARYICAPVWGEPGNAPPYGGQCPGVEYELTYRRRSQFYNGACDLLSGDSGPVTALVIGPVSNLRAELYGDPGSCGGLKGARYLVDTGAGTITLADSTQPEGRESVSVELISITRTDGLPDDCGSGSPIIDNPYTPGDPVDTPYGPITVEPKPWGPRINLPDGPPIDIPVNPTTPPPTGGPDNGPITPHPDGPITPNPDGDTDFPPAPEGFEYVGAAWTITDGIDVPGVIPGTQANPVFPKISGNMRLKVDQNGLTVASTQAVIRAASGFVVRNNPGLSIKGVFVNTLPLITIQIYPLLGETT